LDAELLNTTTNEKAEGGAVALNIKAPKADHNSAPHATNAVN
jgi:hypothetical protein